MQEDRGTQLPFFFRLLIASRVSLVIKKVLVEEISDKKSLLDQETTDWIDDNGYGSGPSVEDSEGSFRFFSVT